MRHTDRSWSVFEPPTGLGQLRVFVVLLKSKLFPSFVLVRMCPKRVALSGEPAGPAEKETPENGRFCVLSSLEGQKNLCKARPEFVCACVCVCALVL